MRHALVFVTVFFALVALWLYQDRREIARRTAGIERLDATLPGCALLLVSVGVYTGVMLWQKNVVAALVGMVAVPPLLSLAVVMSRAALQKVAPKWFPAPPALLSQSASPSGSAAGLSGPAVRRSAFGRPAPAFETVGTWLSIRGNCRNTAWTPAIGPREPRLVWRWDAIPPPEFRHYVFGAPTVDCQGRAYLATSHGLVALDPDGRQLWSLGEGYASSPALDLSGNVVSAFEKRVLVASPGGEASWHDHAALAGGAVTIAEDGSIFVAGSGRLTALHSDGTVNWSSSCARHVDFPPAVSSKGIVCISSHDTIAWNPEDPSSSYDCFQAFSANGIEIDRVDADDEGYSSVWGGTAAICLEDGTPVVGIGEGIRIGSGIFARQGRGTLAVDPEGTLFVASNGLAAIDLERGREKWRAPLDGVGLPIVDGEGTLYVGGSGLIAAISSAGRMMWSWPVPNEQSHDFGWLEGLAIGPDRTLYVATRKALFALRA